MFQCTPWKRRSCCTHNTTKNAHHSGLYNFNYDHCSQKKNMSEECKRHFLQDLCFYECSPNIGPWTVRVSDIQVSLLLCTWAWQLYCIETQYLPSTKASLDRCHTCGHNRRDIQNMCVFVIYIIVTNLLKFIYACIYVSDICFLFQVHSVFQVFPSFVPSSLLHFSVMGMKVTHCNCVRDGIKSSMI